MARRKTKPKKNNLPKTPQSKKSNMLKSLKKNTTTISGKENEGELQNSQIDPSKPVQSKRCSPPSKSPKCSKKNCKITAKHHHGLVI